MNMERIGSIQQEIQILSQLVNKFIIRYEDSFHDDHFFFILTEYCQNGDLKKEIQKRNTISNDRIKKWIGQMIEAIYYLHNNIKQKVIHRDLKPANIFLTERDSIKIGDFGVSRQIDSTIDVSTYQGTFEYMSPEVRAHTEYSFNTDCWSLGCVLYELITLEKLQRAQRIETDYRYVQIEISNLNTLNLFNILLNNMLIVDRENRAESKRLKAIFYAEHPEAI